VPERAIGPTRGGRQEPRAARTDGQRAQGTTRSRLATAAAALSFVACVAAARDASAEDAQVSGQTALDPNGPVPELSATPPEPSIAAEAIPDAPPPPPLQSGVVIDASLGALGFLGEFKHVAPVAPWLHAQVGYEIFRWLMVFGEGELAFSDTSVAQDASKTRAFPMFGFGAGARVTVHATPRVALFLQPGLGLMKADVPQNAFAILGYKKAESLGLYLGGRVGVEWYQVDRHLALGLAFGVRDATGFARTIGSDTPLMWDGGASIRYTF